jgi:uncharacterized protein DUF1877
LGPPPVGPISVHTAMSMLAKFVQVEPGLLERIRRQPGAAEQLFTPAPPPGAGFDSEKMRALIMARGPALMAGALDQFPGMREQLEQRLGATQDELRQGQGGEALLRLMQERMGARPSEPLIGAHAELSLDKAWHGLHYLLCASAEPEPTPLGQAVLGGDDVGEDFAGYGPARALDPAAVETIAVALADPELASALPARYDARAMTKLELYPFGWDEQDAAWLLDAFANLRGLYADAAAHGRAVVTCLV